ncbi:hypothetical protein [Desulfonatronum thioautotrophicum]|uniref:hypothetical protein n=1 Tax=Desulfonatronum thioautotrophicum TaxID=617001 RepID=UPI0012947778|nr:hypothetical protein [Desulfonatronum thioautotrophicum]
MKKNNTPIYFLRLSRNILVLVLVALLVPIVSVAFFFSVSTPFALIDDYASWVIFKQWQYDGLFRNWFDHIFFGTDLHRYIPFHYIYNFLSWKIFGPSPELHHLGRWAVKIACFALGVLSVARVNGVTLCRQGESSILSKPSFFIVILSFLVLFFVFPNQPGARLVPQEIYVVFFLSLINFSLALLLTTTCHRITPNHCHGSAAAAFAMLFLGFLGLSFSKEISVSVMAWLILFLFFTMRQNFSFLYRFSLLTPLVMIFTFTVWRIKVASANTDYGLSKITVELLVSNFKWLYKDIFQFSTSLPIAIVLVTVFLFPVLYILVYRKDSESHKSLNLFLFLIYGQFLSMFVFLCTSLQQVLRYWYPVIPLLAIIISFSFYIMLENCKFKVYKYVLQCFILFFLMIFIAKNSHNYISQYIYQHSIRSVEFEIIDRTRKLIDRGEDVHIVFNHSDPNRELNINLIRYFVDFRDFFYGERSNVTILNDLEEMGSSGYLVSPKKDIDGFRLLETFSANFDYPLYNTTGKISAFLQLRSKPRVRLDHGVHGPDYTWGIFEKECQDQKLP